MVPQFRKPLHIGHLELGLLFVSNGCLDDDISNAVRGAYDVCLDKLNTGSRYEMCEQGAAIDEFNKGVYNTLIVNHDYGEGLVTLSDLLKDGKTDIPTGYVVLGSVDRLISDYLQTPNRVENAFNPENFDDSGIKVLKGLGEKSVLFGSTVDDLTTDSFNFLRNVIFKRAMHGF